MGLEKKAAGEEREEVSRKRKWEMGGWVADGGRQSRPGGGEEWVKGMSDSRVWMLHGLWRDANDERKNIEDKENKSAWINNRVWPLRLL